MTGVRQRQVLDVIVRHGGVYPTHWTLRYETRVILDHLVATGRLFKVNDRYQLQEPTE